jgi:hypothetical protein
MTNRAAPRQGGFPSEAEAWLLRRRGTVPGVDPADDRTDADIIDLASRLRESGNLHPLIALLRNGEVGPERAREALMVLGETDLSLLVQLALDALISEYLEDPGLAHQPNRQIRGQPPPAR